MTSLNTECSNTRFPTNWEAEVSEGQQPNTQLLDCWTQTLQHSLRPLSVALYCYLFQVSLFPSKAFFPLHTHWYIRLSFPPHPPPAILLSEWPARALWGARCSRWKAVAVRCHPSAAPWLPPCSHVVSESGRCPWIAAGLPCKSGRTNRAGAPWAERRQGYNARALTGGPCGREWTRTWIQTQEDICKRGIYNPCNKTSCGCAS